MELFRKPDSRFWWFDFKVRGKRYRGSTKETNSKRAGKIAALKLAKALEGTDPLVRKVRRWPNLPRHSRSGSKRRVWSLTLDATT